MRAGRLRVLALAFLSTLACAAAWGEDIPAFDYAYGQPPIQALRVSSAGCFVPPVRADASRIYVGGLQVNVFSREGDWQGFWPFSSPARGLGGPLPDAPEPVSQVWDMALAPAGLLYLLDRDYATVQRYTSVGEFVSGLDLRPALGPTSTPVALAVSPDSSLYVLDGVYPQRLVHLSADGALLQQWPLPEEVTCSHIAPGVPSGVWALLQTWEPSQVSQVVYYNPDGSKAGGWEEPSAYALETDSAGNVYLLRPLGDFAPSFGVVCYNALGQVLKPAAPVHSYALDFSLTPEGTVLTPSYDGYTHSCRQVLGIEEHDWDGNPLLALGDAEDMERRAALMSPRSAAFTPDGQTYVRAQFNLEPPGPSYVAHFDTTGELVDVTETASYPFYNGVTGTVELLPEQQNAVAADGTTYSWVCMRSEDSLWAKMPGTDSVQWQGPIQICGPEQATSVTIPGPVVAGEAPCCTSAAVTQEPGGTFLVGLYGFSLPDVGVAWAGVFDADWKLLDSWQTPQHSYRYVGLVARDLGGSFYLAGEERIAKFSASGEYLGEIGLWPGAGSETESLILQASSVHIDENGHVRVLDAQAGRILVFTYRPGPFPDVPWYFWAKDEVQAAVDAKIVAGYQDGTYRPEVVVTRDQMATYIARALAGGEEGVPEGPQQPTFYDVPKGAWAYRYVEYCTSESIVRGYDDRHYRPELPVDRGQMAAFVARSVVDPTGDDGLQSYVPPSTPSFPDVGRGFWAYRYIEYSKAAGIVAGYPDGLYHPEIAVTRDQMAVYVARAFKLPL